MKYSSIPAARSIVHHCKVKGIVNIIISPGSRNAPLTIGFTTDPFFKCYSIVDERCAAFFALGISQQLHQPVAVLCTSGSALLNYYPAVAEAFYSDIPLVVISADRPSYKVDVGDGQTIRQQGVFERHIGYSANLKQDVEHAKESIRGLQGTQSEVQLYNDGELNRALNTALETRCPVHINVPFEEPLYETVQQGTVHPKMVPPVNIRTSGINELSHFASHWNSAGKKMILVGTNPPDTVDQALLDVLAGDPSVLIFTETTSNIHHPKCFSSIDSIIAPIEKSARKTEDFKALQPEILLTFGGMIVSKKIKAFLRNYPPGQHWHVDSKKAYDTFFRLSHHFKTHFNLFLQEFIPLTKEVESNYQEYWKGRRERYIQKRAIYLKEIPFTDLQAFGAIMNGIPKGYQVQLANSSTVRYAQLFEMDASHKVFCNRGTSGIDGSTSTAIGASLYEPAPTLLLTGDLSFIYDSNGLWNNYLRPDFRIIVINNGGGGIFRILPGREETQNFRDYFETVQDLEIDKLCSLYGIAHSRATDMESLTLALSSFYAESETPKLLEVSTPRLINDKILLAYFDFIS
ncbi:MAG TPA: 2-succinyl-5-enolpyruvyl-6-hydroxy-3-cyclohexene-1-carboxylic-acid synthase [Eudoraea sp.]|nr:2-succinyl-5-enolpyruvyl-6-hydroxy-3-cyclohexene-1-carboxylic-acid synthase [Eudoraea sp.]